MVFTNGQIARKLREVAAAYTIKKAHSISSGQGNIFQIRAYETAADVIECSTSEIHDLWEEGRLDQIPGVGESLRDHLEELFKTGKVDHWEEVKKGIPKVIFELLDVPGIGPKTALKLSKLGVRSVNDLENQLKSKALIKKGFSEKLAQRMEDVFRKTLPQIKSGRILLPYAFTQAEKIINYLKDQSAVERIDVLGSLRRMVVTVGDLDFAVASREPSKVVEKIVSMPGVSRVVDKGETKVTVNLSSGLQVDFVILKPHSYGSLLQYFTGSKMHNIHLRTIAEKMGLSLSEYGVKNVKTGRVHPTPTEEEFYKLLKMDVPPPELREDRGEIEAALGHQLPHLVELKDMKGDLHVHSNFPLEPSHDLGADDVRKIIEVAADLGYEYIGISDHQPSAANHSPKQVVELIEKRSRLIDQINYSYKNIRVLNLLEVDILPDGSFSVPDEGLKLLDFAVLGVHSAHHQPKAQMTKRLLKALANPYVKVLAHPTNRLLNEREASEVDWPEIFKFAAAGGKALEINAYPNRLDLPDDLAREAKSLGVKLVISTDSHEALALKNMFFGVSVARRGWLTKDDIINSWEWTRFAKWFNIRT